MKVLNPSNDKIIISKGRTIAEFTTMSNDYSYVPITDTLPVIQNMQISKSSSNFEDSHDKERLQTIQEEFQISSKLSEEQRQELTNLLNENFDLFVTKQNPDLGLTDVVQHHISLKPDFVGKHHKPYRLPPYKREVLREHLDNLLKQNIIAPVSQSEDLPITSPIVLVSKRRTNKNDKSPLEFRFCCDFRHLNSQTQDFKYTIPNLQELTEAFSERTPNYITSLDLSSGFFQMGITPESTRYTAFNTCFGTYKFLRLPMGLKTSPNTFQLLMDKVLHGLKFRSCLCYLDDVLICSETFEQHLSDLKEIFSRFREAGLKLGPKKCKFADNSCIFLGHLISKDGILPPPDRVAAINEYPIPRNVKELRRLIGLFNWFRKFIPNLSAIMSPLTRLLKKGQSFYWGVEQQSAFTDLKHKLTNSDMLSFPNYNLPFRLAVDSSSRGIGYMLYQLDPEDNTQKPHIIRFGSKSLSVWQQAYGPTKLELLGMVVSILDCADYLRGTHFIVECDHQALQPLFQKQFKGAIYERWLAILQQFNFDIQYKPAEQMQVPDSLSRCEIGTANPVESPVEEDPYFPFVPDNTGNIVLPDGQNFSNLFASANKELEGECTPVVQTMHAILPETYDDAYDADTDEVDNEPSRSRNKKHNNNLQPKLSENIERIGVDTEKIRAMQRKDSDLKPIIAYLETGILPESQKDARRILLEASDFVLVDEVLYHGRKANSRRTKQMIAFQLVLPKLLVPVILQMAHDSPLGGHSGIQNTLDCVKEHYFFKRMGKIITDYVQSCHECQSRKVSNCKTKARLIPYKTPSEPFQVWQIDLYGPLSVSNNGNQYIFTAVDMFSNFLFALPLRNKDALSVSQAIFNLISSYGVCQTLISDQGTEFISKCTMTVCKTLNVYQEFTPSMIHHCLGRCERTHRTLAERLTPFMLDNKQWEDMLPAIVFSINCCVNPSSKYSPFEIVYGKRPAFPLALAQTVDFRDLPKDIHTYMNNFVDRLTAIREEVKCNTLKAQEKMEVLSNEKVHELKLSVGDFVYLLKDPAGPGQKFKHTYDGPFVVNKLSSPHLIVLRDPTGNIIFRRPVHINRLKPAHVRQPLPAAYFQQTVDESDNSNSSIETSGQDSGKDNVNESEQGENSSANDHSNEKPTRPRRNIRKPVRFRDSDHVELDLYDPTKTDSDTNELIKVKRILAKKKKRW